ncbi:MAG: hypothetical protein ABI870_06950, partial [Rhodanobacter sp.]
KKTIFHGLEMSRKPWAIHSAPPELGFDGSAEAGGAIGMLTLQVQPDLLEFFRRDGLHKAQG